MKPKRGKLPWAEMGGRARAHWRKELHGGVERALAQTKLPERPDREAANRPLVKARRETAAA
jgi:hypothetical protein